MRSAKQSTVPTWLRVLVWSIAIALAIVGIVLAVVSSSFWPLIAFAGLAVPMMPIGSMRSSRRAAADPR
ncbi:MULTISPECIES: hypothetical protein [Microbacterium]|uniref:Uncharacterized protein n=1 Tax=Microbacterium aurantiacum TaxID=162393 RepID=A0A0M8MH03_9MICO|nr:MULTISPECIES: hypothetical protein [Microbacterium]ANG84228.1 hypothetical protein A8L33_01375 [Microbacterium chocolatum]KOS09917.1 hypothetical protein XI38_13620 [Microbacterium chocolatum]MCC4268123.1 hypothetical protein [Microbacterium schleiferi]